MATRAFIGIIDDYGTRGVHLSDDGETAFDLLATCYQERNRAEALVAFGDILALDCEPIDCRFYAFRNGLPETGRTLDKLLNATYENEDHVLLYDARANRQQFESMTLAHGQFSNARQDGAWSELVHEHIANRELIRHEQAAT